MISKGEGFSVLVDTISSQKFHQDYKHVTELAAKYKKLITGDKIETLLRQFVRREDDALFNQRTLLTQSITPSISASLMTPFYKVGRVNSIIKKIDFDGAESSEKKKQDIEKAIKEYNGNKSLDSYLATRLVDLNFCDPNSFIVTEFDAVILGPAGEMTSKVKPRPFEVPSENAINYEYKNNILQWLVVRLPITYKSVDKDIAGYSYTIYLKDDAVKFTQVDPNSVGVPIGQVIEYETLQGVSLYYRISEKEAYRVEYFEHKAGKIPAVRVGYKLDLITNGRTCVSPMHDAMPYFMKSIKTVSEFDLTMALHAFPQKFQFAPRCAGESEIITCNMGKTPDGAMCGSCKGSGYALHTSAQDAVVIALPKNKEDAFDLKGMVHYEYPPIDLLTFQDKFIKELKEECRQAVYNSEIFSKTEVAATATEKLISLDAVYDTLFPYAQKHSEVWLSIVEVMSKFVDIPDILLIHQFPKDFKFKSVVELLSELKVATESGAPGYVRQEISMDIAEQQFVDKPEELNKIKIKQKFYPFPDKTPTEIVYILSNNLSSKYNEVLWSNFDNIFIGLEIDAEEEDKYFYDYAYKLQKKKLDDKVAALMLEIDENQPAPAISFNETAELEDAGGATDDIGKLPLALQQLALAKFRANEDGDIQLANQIKVKMNALLKDIK